MGNEPSTKIGSGDFAERIHSKEEVEGAERVDELDPGQVLAEAGHDEVAALAELAHHALDVLFHALVAERGRGGELGGVIRPGRRV